MSALDLEPVTAPKLLGANDLGLHTITVAVDKLGKRYIVAHDVEGVLLAILEAPAEVLQ